MNYDQVDNFNNALRGALGLDPLPFEPFSVAEFTLDGVHYLTCCEWRKRLGVTRNAVRWRQEKLEQRLADGWEPAKAYAAASKPNRIRRRRRGLRRAA